MESLLRERVIVLRQKKWGDYDLLFSFLSENSGLIDALGVGMRKAASKLVGHLTLPGVVEVQLHGGRRWKKIIQAYRVETFPLKEYEDFAAYAVMVEVLEKTQRQGDPQKAIFDLTYESIKSVCLAQTKAEKKLVLNLFFARLMRLLGYDLKLNSCSACGGTTGDPRLSVSGTGVVCHECGEARPVIPKEIVVFFNDNESSRGSYALTSASNDWLFDFWRGYFSQTFERAFKLNY